MVFSSPIFLFLFLPLTLFLYYITPFYKMRLAVLLFMSLFFYSWGEPVMVVILVATTFVSYLATFTFDKYRGTKLGRTIFIASLFAVFIPLFVCKYYDFFASNINSAINSEIPLLEMALPAGISFYTFQLGSYVVDVYVGKVKIQKNFAILLTYISFFPQLIAGPIVRYSDIEYEITHKKRESWPKFIEGVERFILGLFKKMVIADALAIPATYAFDPNNEISVIMSWVGIIAFTLQIYFDFSAYSDMAIGLGKMFGFTFLENFNYPYMAKTVSEFWQRWHMSLGSWFREYVYIPLGGNRVNKKRLVINLLIVWTITGFWHGANWTFLFWGFWFGVFIVLEKATPFGSFLDRHKIFGHFFTLVVVMFGWVFFQSPDMVFAVDYFRHLFGMGDIPLYIPGEVYYIRDFLVIYIVAIIFAMPTKKIILAKLPQWGAQVVYLTLFIIAVSYIYTTDFSPFIYFNF